MSAEGNRVKPTVEWNHVPSGGDCDVVERLERGDHPLLNDLILETLYGFVRRFDLKVCRFVCKKWNLHTIPHMRSHFKVIILGSESKVEKGEGSRRIGDFVELFSSNELGIPFGKFQLGPFCSTEGVGQQFLQLCGETATEIDLNGGEESEVYGVEDVSELLRCCPNIKVLALPDSLVSPSRNIVKLFPDSILTLSRLKKITFRADYETSCPTSIEEMLTAGPNITEISVYDLWYEEEEEENSIEKEGISDIGVVLNCIEKLGLESSIQSLFLDAADIDNIEHLKRMGEEKGLKLKSLDLNPYLHNNNEFDVDAVQIQLATCFRDSLEYLNVHCVKNILMEFPNMPKLKSLSLQVDDDFDPKPINLNSNFPALQTLDLSFEGDDPEDWNEFFTKFEFCPTLRSLIVQDEEMKIHTLHNILRVFPNLTKFNLNVDEDCVEILRQIWSQMTRLESLSISGYIERKDKDYLDSLFTGISIRALKQITPIVNSLGGMTTRNRRETILQLQNDHSQLPSLRNLTKLRHLELFVHEELDLSDLTAYLTFYSMNHLNHLDINPCNFTRTSCKILTKETGLESWGFQNRRCRHIIPPFVRHDRENQYN